MTASHKTHVDKRMSHSDCSECRADCERRFVSRQPFKYAYVSKYLAWAKPRIQAIRDGNDTVDARIWQRDFVLALNRRISSHLGRQGRKFNDSYLERMKGMNRCHDVAYLQQFAQRGASCLDR